ncbi:50S ribosomal protein L10 [Candidatus Blochmannia ocreatus (nom. nud.)]|uniref:Large ribosomal subunit protein uL10 n=1 Tax=Candidatus Blochmannia ocreatus (nom. nud.) TaxID=251538 RepID=A0ABY4SSS8_9ENTR|nr:50S ribosomal protein L10 [Candidatus Blochmannia ocreatus]URJ25034.1 50S ribosomal protein L10 [Candidatus Blochmannia ocreatus]
MVLGFQKKKDIICNINKIAQQALSAVIASIEKISVNEISYLRKEARNLNVHVYVIRNTLIKKIIEHTSLECLKNTLFGQNIIAFSMKQPQDSVRIFVNFSKHHENFQIKGAAFEGKFIPASQISILYNLPNKQEAIYKLINAIHINSIGNLISILYLWSNKHNKHQIN